VETCSQLFVIEQRKFFERSVILPSSPDWKLCDKAEKETSPTAEWINCFKLLNFTVRLFNGSYVSVVGILQPSGHYIYRTVVTICTAQWSIYLPPGLSSAHTVYLCVLFGSQNKQRLFPYTTLSDWLLYQRFNPLKPSGLYMYHQFNIQQFYVLPTQCIYVFCVNLRTNSDYFPIQH